MSDGTLRNRQDFTLARQLAEQAVTPEALALCALDLQALTRAKTLDEAAAMLERPIKLVLNPADALKIQSDTGLDAVSAVASQIYAIAHERFPVPSRRKPRG